MRKPNYPITNLPKLLNLMALFSKQSSVRRRPAQEGYVLLSLLLMVALLIIAAAAVLPSISFEIKRDREQELIHRGVQDSRAIPNSYKNFGRYPTPLQEL